MAISSVVALIWIASPAAYASKGQFHVSCAFSHAATDDPIVFPGQPGAGHLHDFFGNTSTNAFSTYGSMRRARTTCDFSGDTSGYWTPALMKPNGHVVTPLHMTAYYYSGPGSAVRTPPKNFRMIAGGDTNDLQTAGYACGGGNPTSRVPMNCPSSWLKGVIVFPSCWDGVHTDSSDHRSHVTYPADMGCPPGFPVQIPKIVVHITYGIHDGRGYTLSSDDMMGMTHGMSLHADFWNTWNQSALHMEVTNCLNAGLNCAPGT